jgi:hypothetical protein
MPKPTRDQQFQKSFKLFFDGLTSNFYQELQEYNIESITENKGLSEQLYVLTIPREIVFYHIDVFVADHNGIIHPPGPIMKKQFIPNPYDFIDHFEHHFEQYELEAQRRKLSFVHLSDFSYQKDEHIIDSSDITDEIRDNNEFDELINNYDLKLRILVVYHKSHLPFPIPLTTKEQFEKKCKQLEVRNAELCMNLKSVTSMYQEKEEQNNALRRRLRIDRRNIENKYKIMFDKMQKKFAEFYKEKPTKEDCPVCYEVIDASKLKIPGCCHSICTDCAGMCTNCPLCRESY